MIYARAEDFLSIPELAINPLVDRMLAVFSSGYTHYRALNRYYVLAFIVPPITSSIIMLVHIEQMHGVTFIRGYVNACT